MSNFDVRINKLTNVKLILGNGADLYCKLKTSYKDFFESNVELNKIFDYAITQKVPLNLIKTTSNYIDLNPFLGLKDKNVSIWYLYFYMISISKKKYKIDEIRWCDIEEEIKNSFVNDKYSNCFWNKRFQFLKGEYYEDLHNDHILWLINLKRNYDTDFISLQQFYEYLLDELKQFENMFNDYLKLAMNQDSFPARQLQKNMFGSLLNQVTSIDTFNYTEPNSFYPYESWNHSIRISHVNGSMTIENNESGIFGIDSKGIDPIDEKYIFTKTWRRIEKVSSSSYHSFDFDNIIIFGHSLNEQDYSYFFSVFDILKISDFSENSKIVFAYTIYDENKKTDIIKEQRKKIVLLLENYKKYINKPELNLLETLSFQERIMFFEIPSYTVENGIIFQK